MNEPNQFATSPGRISIDRYFMFQVASDMVDQNLKWSQPVRFKFEKHEDGTVTMWLQIVESEPELYDWYYCSECGQKAERGD